MTAYRVAGAVRAVAAALTFAISCEADETQPFDTSEFDRPVRMACVGASVTAGAGLKDRGRDNLAAQLGRSLGPKWEVRNFGVGGSTMLSRADKPYAKEKAYADALAFVPDVVTICLGGNDVKPDNWQHRDEYVADYLAMIEAFQALPTHPRVYVCYPAPAFPERWGISDERMKMELVPLIDQVAAEKALTIVDLRTPLLGKGGYFPDLIHPDRRGATIMAETVFRVLTTGR